MREGYSDETSENMRQVMRWSQVVELKNIYTISDQLRSAEAQRDRAKSATLRQRFMQVAALLINSIEHGGADSDMSVDPVGVSTLCDVIARQSL